MKTFIGMSGRGYAAAAALVIVLGTAVAVLAGVDTLGAGLVTAFGMAFAAVGRDPNEARNAIADFYGPTTANVLPGRVERGEMVEEHGGPSGFVMRIIETCVDVSREMAAFMTVVHDRFAAKRVPEEVAKKAAEVRARLDKAEAEVQALRDAAAVKRANSFPSERYEADGLRRTLAPEHVAKMNRLLDRLMKETLTRQRGIVVDSARAGDDEPYLAVRFHAPRLIANEVLEDERTMRQLTDTFTERAGTRPWLASAEMAVGLAAVLLDHTRDFIAQFAGPDADREEPLVAGDGRRIARRR